MSFIKKTIILLTAIGLNAITTKAAVPASPHPIQYRLSDGTEITLKIMGDITCNYVINEDGYTVIDGGDGDFYYAQRNDLGELIPTDILAKPFFKLSEKEKKLLRSTPLQLKPQKKDMSHIHTTQCMLNKENHCMHSSATRSHSGLTAPIGVMTSANTIGDLESIVILVEFKDKKFSVENPHTAFDNLLNQEGYSENGATGSAFDYYHENSNGKFNPKFDVYGPYEVSKKIEQYAGNSGVDNVPYLVQEVCKLADSDIDFSRYADNGIIRDIFIFYAGYSKAESPKLGTIWPHRLLPRESEDNFGIYDGAQLRCYAISSELKGAFGEEMSGIGTFCHEFGHVLGWPDIYDTDGATNGMSVGMETLSIMSHGPYNNKGRTPPALSLMEKWMVGWTEPQVIEDDGYYDIGAVLEGNGYLLKTDTEKEYFLIESRGGTKNGVWDKYLGQKDDGHRGLMLTHIDYTDKYAPLWVENFANADLSHECIQLIRSTDADPMGDPRSITPDYTLFPGINNVRSVVSGEHKAYQAWSGAEMKKSLYRITSNEDGTGSFYVRDANKAGINRISISPQKENYSINQKITFGLSETSLVSKVTWYVNGEKIDNTEYIFAATGLHLITAKIETNSGEKLQLSTYINVL